MYWIYKCRRCGAEFQTGKLSNAGWRADAQLLALSPQAANVQLYALHECDGVKCGVADLLGIDLLEDR